jgi:hypothetical protein
VASRRVFRTGALVDVVVFAARRYSHGLFGTKQASNWLAGAAAGLRVIHPRLFDQLRANHAPLEKARYCRGF